MSYGDAGPKKDETAEERDARQELEFSYDREGHTSTLAYVAANQTELALEYLDVWRPRFAAGAKVRDYAAQRQFERWKFSKELFSGASGILTHAIHRQAFHGDFSSPRPLPLEFDASVDYRKRVFDAVKTLGRAMTWPAIETQSNYAKNEREQHLIGQADEI